MNANNKVKLTLQSNQFHNLIYKAYRINKHHNTITMNNYVLELPTQELYYSKYFVSSMHVAVLF